jgi:hypothetical protein
MKQREDPLQWGCILCPRVVAVRGDPRLWEVLGPCPGPTSQVAWYTAWERVSRACLVEKFLPLGVETSFPPP